MADSRGGLQYRISVKDEFSDGTSRFVAGIRAAKDEFAAFRSEVSKGKSAASTIKEVAKASEQAAKSAAKSSAQQEQALKRAAASARQLDSELARISRRRASSAASETRLSNAALRAEQARLRALQAGEAARERTSRRINASLRRDEAQFQREQLRNIRELAARRAEAERSRLQLSRAVASEKARLEAADPQVRGARAAEEAIKRQAAAQAQIAALRSQGREDLVTKQLKRQSGELKESAGHANRLLFTFRRLVGVLAAFQIARAVVSGFRDLITSGVRFNDAIKQAEISIAGLVTGLGDVRNEQGNSVGLAEEYARALGVARRQVDLLRQDALSTTATFEQLLNTFQIAIGPGFAAGLNLDEIRKLSVSISQAATAIGVPQNQLAEEIRSLLSGTIQARTTRIATALQITNADIRRLKETGELFDFLERRFKALGVAAREAASQTLSGISNLVRDALSAVLGKAAEPLFRELIEVGNELFREVLTITDAAGNIRPNPEAVAAFRTLFDGLRDAVRTARELGRELGLEGLRNAFQSIGTGLNVALQAALGFVGTIGRALSTIVAALKSVASLFGVVGGNLGDASRLAGRLLADFLLLRSAAKLFGVNLTGALSPSKLAAFGTALKTFVATPLGKGGVVGAAIVAVATGFQSWVSKIFDVNLSLAETAKLLSIGVKSQLDDIITAGLSGLTTVAEQLKLTFTSDEDARAEIKRRAQLFRDALREGNEAEQAELDKFISDLVNRRRALIEPPPSGQADPAAAKKAEEFATNISNVESIVAKANEGLGKLDDALFEVGLEFDAAAKKAGLEGFAGEVEEALAEAAVEAAKSTRQIKDALDQLDAIFAKASKGIESGRLAEIKQAAGAPVQTRQAALEALELTPQEAQLVSLLRDEAKLRETILEVENESFRLAGLKIGLAAREALPALQRENAALAAQLEAEKALTAVQLQRQGARAEAVVQAQNELNIFRQQSQERLRQLRLALGEANQTTSSTSGLADPADRAREKARVAAAIAVVQELKKQLELEEDISAEKEKQLKAALKQAELLRSGSFAEGARAGIQQLADDLPTIFEGAQRLVVDLTNQVSSALASAAVNFVRELADEAFAKEFDFGAFFGNLGLSIAQSLFQNVIDTLLQQLTQKLATELAVKATTEVIPDAAAGAVDAGAEAAKKAADAAAAAAERAAETIQATQLATIETTAANTAALARTTSAGTLSAAAAAELEAAIAAAEIRAASTAVSSAHGGGLVGHSGIGFDSGGRVPGISANRFRNIRAARPRHIDRRDTVPAWLQPGEFIIRKSAVDTMGANFFRAVNRGDFKGPPRGAAGETAVGMQSGGRVPEPAPATRRDEGGGTMIVPAVVTSEREMERLNAGGRNAQFRFMRENAGTIRGLLGV